VCLIVKGNEHLHLEIFARKNWTNLGLGIVKSSVMGMIEQPMLMLLSSNPMVYKYL